MSLYNSYYYVSMNIGLGDIDLINVFLMLQFDLV